MKANEFVKKFGLFTAKEYLAGSTIFDNHLMVVTNDWELKCLVESQELVSNFGGLKRAKRILKKAYTSFNTLISVVWNDKPFQCNIQKLEQAITDVESCYD